jgi:DNA mismatch repair protein MutH
MSYLITSVSKVQALAGASAALIAPQQQVGRPDSLTAQRIQVGLVLNQMLGEQAASAYLARQEVDAKVAQRVLSDSGRRRAGDGDSPL